jgi:hypothetical protein
MYFWNVGQIGNLPYEYLQQTVTHLDCVTAVMTAAALAVMAGGLGNNERHLDRIAQPDQSVT